MLKQCILSLLFVSLSAFAVDIAPEQVGVALARAYVPVGFDSNDRAQVVVVGTFPDTCYKVGPTEVEVDQARKLIEVRQSAYYYKGICLPIVDPFDQVVNLGVLTPGDYTIRDGASHAVLGKLPITLTTKSEPDDYLYMPVADAFLQRASNGGAAKVTITGKYSDRCTLYKSANVHYYADVIVVEPIAERLVPDYQGCEPAHTRFSVSIPLKAGLTGTYLLHVRAMNGQAVNKLVDLD